MEKYARLQAILRSYRSVAVAFSGGVDSTLLLKAAHDVLGDRAIALTARSCAFPKRELEKARAFCASQGIRHWVLEAPEIPGFAQNPPNRCYLCKRQLFTQMGAFAREQGAACLAEGSNRDDEGDYRPGLAAVRELGVKRPLWEAGLTKAEIRQLSQALGLRVWDKPSSACLASRFVYGEPITPEKLAMVEQAEQLLLDLGFSQVRVRIHGTLARIELPPQEALRFPALSQAQGLPQKFRALGFSYVTLDLEGYRTGSMNEVLGGTTHA